MAALENKVSDLRGHLSKAKVEALILGDSWNHGYKYVDCSISSVSAALTLLLRDVWTGADDPGCWAQVLVVRNHGRQVPPQRSSDHCYTGPFLLVAGSHRRVY